MIIITDRGAKRITGPVVHEPNPRLAKLELNFLISRNRSIVEYNAGIEHSPKGFPMHGLPPTPLLPVADELINLARRIAPGDSVITA